MKKILCLSILVLLAGCASKEPPFDAAVWFKDAEANMQNKNFEKARKKYQEIEEKAPDKSYDAALMLRVADTYYGEGRYSEALVEYQAFLNYHPVHKDAPYAQYQIAMCNYNDLTAIDRDPTPAYSAIREMRKLLEKYPASGYEEQAKRYITICTDWIADYELYVARFYYKKESYKAAIGRYEQLLKEHAGSPVEKDALYYAGLSYMELGEKDHARAMFEALAEKYPAMKKTAQAHIHKLQSL
jgi:outer membrane protein assembly factor BamD